MATAKNNNQEGFTQDGVFVTDPTMDKTGRFEVVPEIHYGEPYNNFMIEKYEKEFNSLLAGTGCKVSVFETSEIYGDDDEEISKDDSHYGLPMFEAYIEDADEEQIDDTTTGRFCCLRSVCDELEEYVYNIKSSKEIFFDDSKYTYNEDIVSAVFDPECQSGMLETYGDDYSQLKAISIHSPNKIWSVMDGDDDKVHVVAGRESQDVIYYIITNEDYDAYGERYFLGGM